MSGVEPQPTWTGVLSIWGVAAAVSTMSLVVALAHLRADERAAPDKQAAVVEAARKAYEATDSEFRQFRCVIDEVYVWSKRLLEAEQRHGANANAAADHADRMRKLDTFVLELQKSHPKHVVGNLLLATKYYVLEAEANQAAK